MMTMPPQLLTMVVKAAPHKFHNIHVSPACFLDLDQCGLPVCIT